MTNEEAVNVIEKYLRCGNEPCNDVQLCSECDLNTNESERDEAFKIAIEALRDSPTQMSGTSDLISRDEAIDDLHGKDPSRIWDTADIEVWVNGLPSVQPDHIVGVSKKDDENGDDLIRREDALMSLTGEWTESRDEILSKAIRRIKRLPSAQPESCGDAVSRNAIIRALNTMDRYVSDELTLCNTYIKFPKNEVFIVDDVYEEIVENLPSVQQEQQWIPVSERLPVLDEDVLATTAWNDITIAWRVGIDEWRIHEGNTNAETDDLIAWLPLPERYKPQQEGNT